MLNDIDPGKVRTRFAPSPTGLLHVGSARTALFSWLFARSNSGVFILRIEDTDIARSNDVAVEQIFRSMHWLGLDWDEGPGVGGDFGPYRQMEREQLYSRAVKVLLEKARAYRCFCTPEKLDLARNTARKAKQPYVYDRTCRELSVDEQLERKEAGERYVVRLKAPIGGHTVVEDLVKGAIKFDNALTDDFILVRSSGVPTYNFAAAVDDSEMAITHVIRGDDHLPNTPKQLHVIEALAGSVPAYAHLPLILGKDQTPLSKRHGSVSVEEFRALGYVREAMDNYLALLGWSFDGETTLFSINDLVAKFSLDRVGSTAAVFDPDKLLWMNGTYIRELEEGELADRIEEFISGTELAGLPGRDGRPSVAELVPLVQEKMKTLADFVSLSDFFFLPLSYEDKALSKLRKDESAPAILDTTGDILAHLEPYELPLIEERLRAAAAEVDIKLGKFLQPIRIAVSGKTVTPGMFETLAVLGRETSIERLKAAVNMLSTT